MLVRRDILGSLHPVRRHLESPGDDERDGKPKHGQHDHRGCNTVRQMKCRDYGRGDLQDEPADDCIPDRNFINIAALQLGEKVHGFISVSLWKRGSFRSGSNIGSSRSRAGVSGVTIVQPT